MRGKKNDLVLTVPLGNGITFNNVEVKDEMLSVKEVCKLANISRKTLFYYDKIGLLLPKRRVGSQQSKYYDKKALCTLEKIRLYKDAGLHLHEIKEILYMNNMQILGKLKAVRIRLQNEAIKVQEKQKKLCILCEKLEDEKYE